MDSQYKLYAKLEDMKNSVYRQLSSARQSGVFWPKFYYAWFYSDEKTLYNILNFKQKLGTIINDVEVDSYNKIREQIIPKSPYVIKKYEINERKNRKKNKIWDEIDWTRKRGKFFYITPFALIAYTRYLKLSNWWVLACFAPQAIIYYMDRKFVPYTEIENFYKYVWEKRKAEAFYKIEKESIDKEFFHLDKEHFDNLKIELERTNRTIYEVSHDLDEMYLEAAINSSNLK